MNLVINSIVLLSSLTVLGVGALAMRDSTKALIRGPSDRSDGINFALSVCCAVTSTYALTALAKVVSS